MQVKKRESFEKYGISLHSGPVSDPGLGPGGMEALQPCPAASPPLEMSPQPSPLFLFHPCYGLAGTTLPPGRRGARQARGGGRVCPAQGTGGAKVTLTEVEPVTHLSQMDMRIETRNSFGLRWLRRLIHQRCCMT